MAISSWLSWPNSRSGARHAKRPNSAARLKKARFTLEPLEARALLASFTAASVSALIADINAANTNGGANTITLTAATTAPYVLTEAGFGIRAKDTLTIIGNGDTIERSTAAGTPIFRLFYVNAGGSLTLENLTIQGGSATQPVFSNEVPLSVAIGNDGGAIFDQGALTLSGVTVQDNSAASGGGICSYGGSVTLEGGSIVQNNTAEGLPAGDHTNALPNIGGGLYANGGTVTVTNAALDNNDCAGVIGYGGVDYDGEGGGMYAYECTVTMTNATLNNNSVGPFLIGEGRGLYARGGTVTMTNSTVDNNSGGRYGNGGGLCLSPAAIRVSISATLTNCTVQGNSAGQGGGLYFGGGT